MNNRLGMIGCFLLLFGTLTACGGGGGDGSSARPPTNNSNVAGFAYAMNSGSDNISAYTINPTTGALSEVGGSPFATGRFPRSLTVDPSGKFVYVPNFGASGRSPGISAYTVNATTGVLSEVAGSPFAGQAPLSLTVDASGKFAYGPNAESISAYSINATTGALSEVAGSPFVAGIRPLSVTLHPSGKFLYAANVDSDNVSAYAITATGALASTGTVAAGDQPSSVTIDPSGKFAYVNNSSSDPFGCVSPSVSAYTINANTGSLSEVAGSPFATPSRPGSVTVHPSGKFAYVANGSCVDKPSHGISAYNIDASTGILSEVAGSPFTAGNTLGPLSIDRSGKFAYVANSDSDNVSAYAITATGALASIGTVAAGHLPDSVTFDLSGRFAYVANDGSNDVSAYTINPSTGALSEVAGSPFAAGRVPILTIAPASR